MIHSGELCNVYNFVVLDCEPQRAGVYNYVVLAQGLGRWDKNS